MSDENACGCGAVALNRLFDSIQGEQASCLAALARTSVQQLDLQAKMAAQSAFSVDLIEAAAAKELGKTGVGTDLASIRAGSNTPPLPTQGS